MSEVPLKSLKMRSMLGEQPLSTRSSAPSFGFGASTRDVRAKVFISQEHARTGDGQSSVSPGPAAPYNLRASVGKQNDGRKRSSPHWMFCQAERFTVEKRADRFPGPGAYAVRSSIGPQFSSAIDSAPLYGFGSAGRDHVAKVYLSAEHDKSFYGINSPGPLANYKIRASVGKQNDSRKPDKPAWVFGSTGRFKYDHIKRAASSPGPGAYNVLASVGPQVSSAMPSAMMAGFGTGDRDTRNKLFLSHEHEKTDYGRHSPGPMAYTLPSTNGKQMLSRNRSAPSVGFGTGARWSSDKPKLRGSTTPGPGAYSV